MCIFGYHYRFYRISIDNHIHIPIIKIECFYVYVRHLSWLFLL